MNTQFKSRWGLLILCLALMVFNLDSISSVQAQGAQIFVSASGTGTDCTQAAPCLPNQGMTNAVAGDTIYFKYGIYVDLVNNPYLTITKAVSLIGGWDGTATGDVVIDPLMYVTIIDGGGARVIFIVNETSGLGNLITISGIRFQEGVATNFGGAIYVQNGRVDIVNNEFLSNISIGYGAAIAVESSHDVQIIGNLFDNNSAWHGGGGIYIGSNDPDNTVALIEDNTFYSGSAEHGSDISSSNSPLIVNRNTFDETENVSAINLVVEGYPPSIVSNNIFIRPAQNAIESSAMPDSPHLIWNNTIVGAGNGVTLYSGSAVEVSNNIFESCGEGIKYFGGTLTGSNNLFYNNSAYTDVADDPVFADPDFVNAALDDYHINEGSPAIDTGIAVALTEDFDGESRPSGSGFDIGADEYQSGGEIFLPILLK